MEVWVALNILSAQLVMPLGRDATKMRLFGNAQAGYRLVDEAGNSLRNVPWEIVLYRGFGTLKTDTVGVAYHVSANGDSSAQFFLELTLNDRAFDSAVQLLSSKQHQSELRVGIEGLEYGPQPENADLVWALQGQRTLTVREASLNTELFGGIR